ncbi:MAG TPA: ribose 5-phosphate isomerase B [Anaerolineales bacterium]|nr:ribose 5-phosphate isomerase B [Anaerolineales bacterium]
MTHLSDAEIHEIVHRVVEETLGLPAHESGAQTPQVVNPGKKVVAIGADHGGYELKESLKAELNTLGYEVSDVGTNSREAVDYPDFAHAVAQAVGTGKAWRGIMIDGAGIGSCIVANKVPGVRAGMAYDYSSAVNSREHNDTNVLTLGAGLIGVNLAKQIVKTWLTTEFGGGRHTPRLDKIKSVEKKYLK